MGLGGLIKCLGFQLYLLRAKLSFSDYSLNLGNWLVIQHHSSAHEVPLQQKSKCNR